MTNINEYIKSIITKKANQQDESLDKKYLFLQYAFEVLEDLDDSNLSICDDEPVSGKTNIDGMYFDYENSIINLYISIYDQSLKGETIIDEKIYNDNIMKIKNIVESIATGSYLKDFSPFSTTFSFCDSISSKLKNKDEFNIILNVVSNYIIPNSIKKDDIYTISNLNVSLNTKDIRDISNELSTKGNDSILIMKNLLGDSLEAICIFESKDFDIYLTSINGFVLANMYNSDGQRLLESNVRAYLKKTSRVNKKIIATAQEEPEKFLAYNNGLSAVATDAKVSKLKNGITKIIELTNLQIVNGGQTTASLAECLKDDEIDLRKIIVSIKLAIIKNKDNIDEMVNAISTYSNTQTAIKTSDPPSNKPYYKKMEKLSRSILAQKDFETYFCFFERTGGQYSTMQKRERNSESFKKNYPLFAKFTKLELAKAIVCWEQAPYIVNLGQEKNFEYFNDIVQYFDDEITDDYYKKAYAVVIMFREIEDKVREMKLEFKSNVVSYTLSLLSLFTNKSIDLLDIWNKQTMPLKIKNVLEQIIIQVSNTLSKTPEHNSDIRMWSRKQECWDAVKKIENNYFNIVDINSFSFFPSNAPQAFINDPANFKDPSLWQKLTLFAESKKYSEKRIEFLKAIRNNLLYKTNSLSEKVTNDAKKIFLEAVNKGFKYKR